MPPDSLRGVTGAGGGEKGGEGVLSTETSLQLAERPGLTSVTLLMLESRKSTFLVDNDKTSLTYCLG